MAENILTFDMSKFNPEAAAAKIREAAAAGLYQFGEFVMTLSKEMCPVDTGNLRATGHVQAPRFEQGDILVTLGYGGPAASYAVAVHENLMAQHPVGQAKYLELPVIQNAPQLVVFVAAAVRRAAG